MYDFQKISEIGVIRDISPTKMENSSKKWEGTNCEEICKNADFSRSQKMSLACVIYSCLDGKWHKRERNPASFVLPGSLVYIYFCKLEALHWHNPVIPVVGATILSFMKVRPFSDYLPYSSGSVPMCLLHCPSPDFGTGEDCMKAPQCVQCKCKFMQTALRCPNSNFLNWNLVWILAPQHHFMYGPTPPKSVPLPRFE